jgi:polysaccharide chain length determinant protein (PEP-CTERM system associated)
MSSTKLLEIINRFNLYEDLRKKLTIEEVIDLMRKDIRMATISADVMDRKKGGSAPAPVTIAFTLSYEGKNPSTVQKVANVLASLFLEENLKEREARSAGVFKFLDDEPKTVQEQLADLDAKIARYKEWGVTELPELLQVNLQTLERIERDIDMSRDQLRMLREREGSLLIQLASIPSDAANQDRTLLKDLKARLVQLTSKFSDKHPDVIKTKAEIAALDKRLVVQAKEGAAAGDKPVFSVTDQPDNPAYITLASQLGSTQAEIESNKRQMDELTKKRDDYRKRLEGSPKVEEAYKGLLMERNNTQAKFDDLMKKALEARVAQGLEKEQMGERFTLIDPARLPEKPVKPNILAILLIGLFLGVGAGVGTAALKEFSDQSVRSPKALAEITGMPVLVSIPDIITDKDIARKKRRHKAYLIIAIVLVIVSIAIFHFFIMDLDVFWARLSRRVGRII